MMQHGCRDSTLDGCNSFNLENKDWEFEQPLS